MWHERLFSFLFPPRCVACKKEGMLLCEDCRSTLGKTPLQVTSTTWAMFPYHHKVGERLIHAMKFEGKKGLADDAGTLLSKALTDLMEASHGERVIVPIPSSMLERKKRGYDHVALMAGSVSQKTGIPLSPVLEKIRETERQVTMKTRAARLENLKGAFRLKNGVALHGKTLILLDDVTTTGATFAEAAHALQNAGVETIIYFALAH